MSNFMTYIYDWWLLWTPFFISALVWISQHFIKQWIQSSVANEYETKIEKLRSDLRIKEDSLKAEMQKKEQQIKAISAGALSNIETRQSLLYQKRIQAVDDIWTSVLEHQSIKSLSSIMNIIKFDTIATFSAQYPTIREKVAELFQISDYETIDTKKAAQARPFISPMVWASYYAYISIINYAIVKFLALQTGVGKEVIETEKILNTVLAVLPHQKKFIDENGSDAIHYLLEELESKVLEELKHNLEDDNFDEEHIKAANKILKAAEKIQTQ